MAIGGMEPFLPAGSLFFAWSAVLGTKKHDWWGVGAIVSGAVVRDVVLVNRLGISGGVSLLAYLISALAIGRFNRQYLVVLAASAVGIITEEIIFKRLFLIDVAITLMAGIVINWLWSLAAQKRGEIRIS